MKVGKTFAYILVGGADVDIRKYAPVSRWEQHLKCPKGGVEQGVLRQPAVKAYRAPANKRDTPYSQCKNTGPRQTIRHVQCGATFSDINRVPTSSVIKGVPTLFDIHEDNSAFWVCGRISVTQ